MKKGESREHVGSKREKRGVEGGGAQERKGWRMEYGSKVGKGEGDSSEREGGGRELGRVREGGCRGQKGEGSRKGLATKWRDFY